MKFKLLNELLYPVILLDRLDYLLMNRYTKKSINNEGILMSKVLRLFNNLFFPEMIICLVPQILVGYLAANSHNSLLFVYACFMTVIVDFAGNVINNYSDWDLDEENRKRIELHQNLTKKSVLIIFIILSVLLFLMLLFRLMIQFNIYFIMITLIGFGCAFFYSMIFKLKDIVFLNYVTLGIAYGFVSFGIGYFVATTCIQNFIELFWIPLYLTVSWIISAIIKDYEDEEGDRKFNKRTFVTILGKEKSLNVQLYGLTILIALIVIWNILIQKYIIFLVLIPHFLWIVAFIKLKRVETSEECRRIHFLSNGISFASYIVLIPYFFF